MNLLRSHSPKQGFSLMEMLIVIAVIGVITMMVVTIFGGATQAADEAKNRRNAQEIASVASAASAAGVAFLVPNNEEASILNLRDGMIASDGVFKNRIYKLPPMHETEITGAMKYLSVTESELRYDFLMQP